MIRTRGSVVIPIVTWAPDPPVHEITCMLGSPDGHELVTAGLDGNMVLWSMEAGKTFTPRWMVTGHRAAVRNLCSTGACNNDGDRFFFSHSESSELALWNWHNGKCLEFKLDTRYHHVNIKSHQPAFLDYHLLFCCGHYPHIVVIHAMSLSVLFNLASQSQPDWISSFVVFTHPNKRHEVVLGLSMSSVATLWTLNGEEVQILDAMTCSIVLSQPNPVQDPLVGGEFFNSSLIAVHCRSGVTLIYRLKTRLVTGAVSGTCSSEPPVLLAKLLPTFAAYIHRMDLIAHEEGLCRFVLVTSATTDQTLLLAGSLMGQVMSWSINACILGQGEGVTGSGIPSLRPLRPSFVTDLASVWRRHRPRRLLDELSIPNSSSPAKSCANGHGSKTEHTVTACVQIFPTLSTSPNHSPVQCPSRVAFGLSTGRIVIMRLVDFLQTVYWKPDAIRSVGSPATAHDLLRLSRIHLDGHLGPVTSLLHPASADDHVMQNADDSGPSEHTTCQFNPDHLLSGGADFTVRLWDLNPWRECARGDHLKTLRTNNSRRSFGDLGSNVTVQTCLAVFRCHSSPCVALAVGPSSWAVSNSCAGNSRLHSCVCSIDADGTVALISLHEQRQLLFTGPTHCLSVSPVVALGWRVPEDLLFVAHADCSLEVWDISAGCLDRLERDQTAKDLFEQAHYITELHDISSTFGFNVSLLSYGTSGGAGGKSSGQPSRTPYTAFYGCVNNPASASSVRFTAATARLRCNPRGRRIRSHQLSAVQLQTIGSCSARTDQAILEHGPAAFVFHWDMEAIIVFIHALPFLSVPLYTANLLAENEKIVVAHADSDSELTSPSSVNSETCVAQLSFIQLLVSVLHPWGLDLNADNAVRVCCGFVATTDELSSHPVHDSLCLGLLSKHGCLSISMPGWSDVNSFHSNSQWSLSSSSARLYSLCHLINTNLLLAELSLAETLTCAHPHFLAQLFPFAQQYNNNSSSKSRQPVTSPGSFSLSSPPPGLDDLVSPRANWLRLAAHLCGPVLRSMVHSTVQSHVALTCSPELEFLAQKWQDRTLSIRYAARSLLLALLDHLGNQARNLIVNHWSSLLPLFSFASQTSKCSDISYSTARSNFPTVNGSPFRTNNPRVSELSNSEVPVMRKQSLPQRFSDRPIMERSLSSALPNGTVNSPLGNSPQPHLSYAMRTLSSAIESVSLCSLDSTGLNLPSVSDSHWWHTLSGYRISAREHARLQATAVVLLGVIGSRFGANVKRRHPAVAARDLISDCMPIYAHPHSDGHGTTRRLWRHGLAKPCFSPSDTHFKLVDSTSDMLTIEHFSDDQSVEPADMSTVPDGFGFDNYQLARSVSQCLTTLLLNRIPVMEGTSDGNQNESGSVEHLTSRPAYTCMENGSSFSVSAANALVRLLTSNASSSLRRAGIDLLGRGFVVWEPYVDLAQIINTLLLLSVETENLCSKLASWQSIPDRVDLARTAREALWAITFARPKAVTLVLSLEVRRHGGQLNSIASSNATTGALHGSLTRLDSSAILANTATHGHAAAGMPPIFAGRGEVVRLLEQLCVRRASDVVSVLPEMVEVVLACLDKTRLKERGLEFVFPALRQFSAFSTNTRSQKVCVGGINGSLTFFDFKIGRYFVTTGHKGPVTAIRFHTDGRLIATYSLTESLLRVWQLHTTGLFGMGGQQVKVVSTHPVPPLVPPPSTERAKEVLDMSDHARMNTTAQTTYAERVCPETIPVWLDWPEAGVVQLVTDTGVKRRVNI
ncbi:uncharacterized protein DEA37_0005184 [Paragonimus westermani]|uniref:Uncharacterized protein n=1 Tax=Paragonimus westermani TaxID=34504 RepID=A0A5J4NKP0_9TREM|nr:uncharacterized protein DEA37_0005184 [Paragonimus westermani]